MIRTGSPAINPRGTHERSECRAAPGDGPTAPTGGPPSSAGHREAHGTESGRFLTPPRLSAQVPCCVYWRPYGQAGGSVGTGHNNGGPPSSAGHREARGTESGDLPTPPRLSAQVSLLRLSETSPSGGWLGQKTGHNNGVPPQRLRRSTAQPIPASAKTTPPSPSSPAAGTPGSTTNVMGRD